MKKLFTAVAFLFISSAPPLFAACPDFLNHSMRQLASTESIQFCDAYEGKALLIVNTASYCGYTPQFESLERVHREYAASGLVVIGFSSDDFFQEDNDEGDAAEICFEKYEVSFPVMATSAVRGGDANPVFQGLGSAAGFPSWNFNKYVVSAEGEVVGRFSSGVKPDSEELRTAIQAALPKASS